MMLDRFFTFIYQRPIQELVQASILAAAGCMILQRKCAGQK